MSTRSGSDMSDKEAAWELTGLPSGQRAVYGGDKGAPRGGTTSQVRPVQDLGMQNMGYFLQCSCCPCALTQKAWNSQDEHSEQSLLRWGNGDSYGPRPSTAT